MADTALTLLSLFNGYGQGRLINQQQAYNERRGQQAAAFQQQDREGQYIGGLLTRLSSGDLSPEGYAQGVKFGANVYGYDESKYQLPAASPSGGNSPALASPALPAPSNLSSSTPSPSSPAFVSPAANPSTFGASLAGFVGGRSSSPAFVDAARIHAPARLWRTWDAGIPRPRVLPFCAASIWRAGRRSLPYGVSPASPYASPNPFLSPNAALRNRKTLSDLDKARSDIDFNNWKMGQPPPGQISAGEQFVRNLPTVIGKLGLLPPYQQAAAMQTIIGEGRRLGVDVSGLLIPGAQNGTRPYNYGLTGPALAAVGQARQVLAQTTDPSATVNIGGRTYTRQQFAQAFPEGTTPTFNPYLTPDAETASKITWEAARAKHLAHLDTSDDRNYGLRLGQFKQKSDYDAAILKARAYEDSLKSGDLTEKQRHDKATEYIQNLTAQTGRDRLGFEGYKFAHPQAGGRTDPSGQYEKNLARITTLTTAKDPFTGAPSAVPLSKLSPAAQQEVQHLLNQNRRLRLQQDTPAATGSPFPFPVTSVVPTTGQRVPVPFAPRLPGFGSFSPRISPPRLSPAPRASARPVSRSRGKLDLRRFMP